ncbi:MAG: hypothetical protein M3N52_12085 [Actinomycetota bacterium]|nr:hypothetical protein [Actinomycetota bacterium]
MGYSTQAGRYARTRDVRLANAVTVSAVGVLPNSTWELGDQGTLRLTLTAANVGGTTPSITITLETSADGVAGWSAVGAFAAVTADGTQRKIFAGLDRFVRLNATTVTGTAPTASITVDGESA